MFCAQCGAEAEAEDRFCHLCGQAIERAAANEETAPGPPVRDEAGAAFAGPPPGVRLTSPPTVARQIVAPPPQAVTSRPQPAATVGIGPALGGAAIGGVLVTVLQRVIAERAFNGWAFLFFYLVTPCLCIAVGSTLLANRGRFGQAAAIGGIGGAGIAVIALALVSAASPFGSRGRFSADLAVDLAPALSRFSSSRHDYLSFVGMAEALVVAAMFGAVVAASLSVSSRSRGLIAGSCAGVGCGVLALFLPGGEFLADAWNVFLAVALVAAVLMAGGIAEQVPPLAVAAPSLTREPVVVGYTAEGQAVYQPFVAGVANVGTNGFAIASLVLGLVGGSLLAIVFGHVALSQTKRTGQGGRGLAIAGLVLGYLWLLLTVAFYVALFSATN